jgi:hypothetical protein
MKHKTQPFSPKNIIITVILIVFSEFSFGQGNLLYVDDKPIHFGFSLGTNFMDFDVTPSDSARVGTLKPGFSVGIITDLRLSRYLNLRCTPTLHFGERQLDYKFNNVIKSTSVTSIPITLPFYLKYSAERKDNYRPYIIGGGGLYMNLNRDQTKAIVLQPLDFFAEFGVGCDIYFSFFKLSPELKYSIGFNNMLTPMSQRGNPTNTNDVKFTTALSKLTSRILTLTFNFE